MNKVRIIGMGVIFTGFLIGYFFEQPHIYIFSGMLIGVGTGWMITGRLKSRKLSARSEKI